MRRLGFLLTPVIVACCWALAADSTAEEAVSPQVSPAIARYDNLAGPPGPNFAEPGLPDIGLPGNSVAPEGSDLHARVSQLQAELDAIKSGPWLEQAWQPRDQSTRSGEYPTFNWSGFLQVDSGFFIQNAASVAAIGDVSDKTGLRRVRLRAFGHVRPQTHYVVDLDFAASGHPSFRDVMLRFEEIPGIQNIDFGYFQQPFSMDALTSGQELIVMERWLPFAFAPFRQTALGTHGTSPGERVQWGASVYRFPTDDFGNSVGGSGGFALAGRASCLPWYEEEGRRLVHLGLGYSFGDPGDNLVQYRIQPGFFVTDSSGSAGGDGDLEVPVFVDTGPIPTQNYHLFNAELAGNLGPLSLQSEVTVSLVEQRGGPLLAFSGAYVQAAYYLTGETRPYDRTTGVFGQPQPLSDFRLRGHGTGAWQAVAGWSYIDLNDENIQGGRLNAYILGLDWYFNSFAKIQFNYIHAFLDDPETGPSETEFGGVRAQVKF